MLLYFLFSGKSPLSALLVQECHIPALITQICFDRYMAMLSPFWRPAPDFTHWLSVPSKLNQDTASQRSPNKKYKYKAQRKIYIKYCIKIKIYIKSCILINFFIKICKNT